LNYNLRRYKKAQDARNFMNSLQYWLGGSSENLENFLLMISKAGPLLVHFSAQPQPLLVIVATAIVLFSARPETFHVRKLPRYFMEVAHVKLKSGRCSTQKCLC